MIFKSSRVAEKTSKTRNGRSACWTWVDLHHQGPEEPWIDPAGQKCWWCMASWTLVTFVTLTLLNTYNASNCILLVNAGNMICMDRNRVAHTHTMCFCLLWVCVWEQSFTVAMVFTSNLSTRLASLCNHEPTAAQTCTRPLPWPSFFHVSI